MQKVAPASERRAAAAPLNSARMIQKLIDFVLHIDKHLDHMATDYGPWLYGILFAIIFVETGLIVMPFLPGDSLLFAAGVLVGRGTLSPWILFLILPLAAIIGDNVNYGVGTLLRSRVKSERGIPLVKPKHIDRTQAFFARYGPKAIIFARFVPIVRTMMPFCAGVGAMQYRKFLAYSLCGGVGWVLICVGAGYFFGQMEFVNKHFELVILAVIGISLLPMVVEFILHKKREAKKSEQSP